MMGVIMDIPVVAVSCGRLVLKWPLLAPVTHFPEQPLVTARRAEVAAHGRTLDAAELGSDLVGRLKHRASSLPTSQ